jgi:hypothetical protein
MPSRAQSCRKQPPRTIWVFTSGVQLVGAASFSSGKSRGSSEMDSDMAEEDNQEQFNEVESVYQSHKDG